MISIKKTYDYDIIHNDVQGWYFPEQAKFVIKNTLSSTASGCIVEIGSFLGRSAIYWAANMPDIDIYCIDPWEEWFLSKAGIQIPASKETFYATFIESTFRYKRIIPIRGKAEEVVKTWDKPIKMLHIDGNHDYEYVHQDYLLWKDKVVPGGLIFFHDYEPGAWPGVVKTVEECEGSGEFKKIDDPPLTKTPAIGMIMGFIKL